MSIRVLSTKKLNNNQKQAFEKSGIDFSQIDFINVEQIPVKLPEVVKNAVVTSQNAARYLVSEGIKIQQLFCVGEKTARVFSGYNVKVVKDNSKNLSEIIIKHYSQESFVFFSGNRRLDTLPETLTKKGVDFKEIQVYKTIPAGEKTQIPFDGILFFSPSAAKRFLQLNTILEHCICFCIGNTTAAVLTEKKVIVAKNPSIESVIQQVLLYFSSDNFA